MINSKKVKDASQTLFLRRQELDVIIPGRSKRRYMSDIQESYRKIGDEDDRFDIDFWQSQGEQAIFAAALEMIQDYLIIKYGHADEPRLQRTVEHFGKA